MLMYGRNQHNIIKQLSSDLKLEEYTYIWEPSLTFCDDLEGWEGIYIYIYIHTYIYITDLGCCTIETNKTL